MKTFFIIAVLLQSFITFGQKNLNIGQGVLKIDFEKLPSIQFFGDTSQTNPVKIVTVIKTKEGEYNLKNNSQVTTWFKPESLWLDYSIFVIRVDTIVGKWYRVYIDNNKGTTLWTKTDPTKKFVKWQTFLVNETTFIDKNPDFNIEIKNSPSDDSPTIKMIEKTDCFEAIEIKGDWLRVRTNTIIDCNESKKTIKSGWIKWRKNNRLTINYGLTC